MSPRVKIILYVLFSLSTIICAIGLYKTSGQAMQVETSARLDKMAAIDDNADSTPDAVPTPDPTNPPETQTNLADATGGDSTTNSLSLTNGTSAASNAVVAKASSSTRNPPPPAGKQVASRLSRMMAFGVAFFFSLVCLGVLIAYDFSHWMGRRAEALLYNDDGVPIDPAYEQAEAAWADGRHLDAVQLMRDYLKDNPRELHVALRIAEIYEKDLKNPLAAALEYEEVLKKPLPPERWGWAAIHLCNIYSSALDQPDKSVALLKRIDAEYGQTGAAKKARERLAQIEPEYVSPSQAAAMAAEEERQAANLPPGFRPKAG